MEINQEFAYVVPMVIGLVAAFKKAGLDTRYAPVLALIAGISVSFLFVDGKHAVVMGVIAGLTASGLFSGVKTTLK